MYNPIFYIKNLCIENLDASYKNVTDYIKTERTVLSKTSILLIYAFLWKYNYIDIIKY